MMIEPAAAFGCRLTAKSSKKGFITRDVDARARITLT
jgi:hypothetical protein